MDIRKIETRNFSGLPSKTRDIFNLRLTELTMKLGRNLADVYPLRDFRLCFGVNDKGCPVMGHDGFKAILNATGPKHVSQVAEYLPRTNEKGKHTGDDPGNPFSHIATSMFFLRPDISPFTLDGYSDMLSFFTAEAVDIRPFLSLNDFSFISMIFSKELPALLEKETMRNLLIRLRQALGPQIHEDDSPFSRAQTDLAAETAYQFLNTLKLKWSAERSIKRIKLEGLKEIMSEIKRVRGEGVEYAFAPKDLSFFKLGDEAGDCSAFVRKSQFNQNMENVFYDVPMWLSMPNYQVLKGYYNGKFVIKFHLVIASIFDRWTLLVDATETTPLVRDDIKEEFQDPTLIKNRQEVFTKGISAIRMLGEKMGNPPILAEFFSNTEWVRNNFEKFPKKAVFIPEEFQDGLLIDGAEKFLAQNSVEADELLLRYRVPLHIQVQRTDISDQGVKNGYRILYIIEGMEPDRAIPYRGI